VLLGYDSDPEIGPQLTCNSISKLLDKMNTFPCTPFIEEGCLALREHAEYRTDKDLYHVIRLQRIIENIDKIANVSDADSDAQSAYLRVRNELEEFRGFMSSDVSDSCKFHYTKSCKVLHMLICLTDLMFMQFHTAKLFLYQVAFFERNLQHSPALNLNILREGLEGAKSFLDLYLWLPPKFEMALTNSEWIQLSFGVTLAAKFAVVSKDPNVEPQTRELRHRLNIDNVFRHLSLRIGALVGRAGEANKQKDIFFHYEQRVRKIAKWYSRMMEATGADSPTNQTEPRTTPRQQLPPLPQPHIPSQQNMPHQVRMPQHASTSSSQVPVSVAFSHQQPQGYASSYPAQQVQPTPDQSYQYQAPMATVGMTPMSTYQQYSPCPAIAFPDLMNAQGWDNMFTIPMEHDAMIFDVSQGYGLGIASPPSDTASQWDNSSTT
jgi:hypothetical protein